MTIMPAEKHLDVRVVVHTHWDREWYQPEPRFRQRLVSLVDSLLDRDNRGPFLLDGQAVLLEDYLGVRPERAADLSGALRRGTLEAGPWFVLADELHPSGEGLVRNLLEGRRVLSALRASPPGVLYCPDSFGHPAMLPAIANGFGLATIVLWRGYGGRGHPASDTARWVAPDGSAVLLYHLPPDGYEFGSHLPVDPVEAARRWTHIHRVLGARSSSGVVLLTAGADHHVPQDDLDPALRALQAAAEPSTVRRTSLSDFEDAWREAASRLQLPDVHGELRDSYGYTWTLQGTLGSRAMLKREYARAESCLLRDVEPWVALACHSSGTDRRHLLRAAWRPVLLCQPHDTLCGCSVDDVASAMARRLREARQAADEIRESALYELLGHDPDAARAARDDWHPVVVVRNPAPAPRSGVAEIEVDIVLANAPVGPGSAGVPVTARRARGLSLGEPAVPLQELGRERMFAREESPRGYPLNRLIERRRVLALVGEVPGTGLVTLPIRGARKAAAVTDAVSASEHAIEGNGLRVHVRDGRLQLVAGATRIDHFIGFEAEGERGDLYTASPIPGTRTHATLVNARVTARGPLRAELTVDWRLVLSPRRLTSAAGVPRRHPRSVMRLRTVIRIQHGEHFVRVLVSGRNAASDVRVRFVVQMGVRSPIVDADAALGLVRREGIAGVDAPLAERPPATAPLHRYVTLSSPGAGATLVSDGLTEYEARDDGSVLVTLLRAVGELSRHDLPERPGHAGYPVSTPLAQSMGVFEAGFAVALHGPRTEASVMLAERIASDVLTPCTGTTLRSALDPPGAVHGFELAGEGLAESAMKSSDDGTGVVLRCVNLLDRPVAGAWRLPHDADAFLTRLDETVLGALDCRDGLVAFEAPPRAVVSILVRRDSSGAVAQGA